MIDCRCWAREAIEANLASWQNNKDNALANEGWNGPDKDAFIAKCDEHIASFKVELERRDCECG